MIIDIHTHLGDILNPGGGGGIFRSSIRAPARGAPLRVHAFLNRGMASETQ